MSVRFSHKKTGRAYHLKKFDNGYHVVIPVKSEDEVIKLLAIAHGARMKPEEGKQANIVSFQNVEKI